MANLVDNAAAWVAAIRQLETTDPVIGGPPDPATGAGMSNIPHKQLADRTAWLKGEVARLDAVVAYPNPAGSSLTNPGYARVGASGLIVTWGRVWSNPNAVNMSFLAPFPRVCFGVVVTDFLDAGASASAAHNWVAVNDVNRTGFNLYTTSADFNAAVSTEVFYIALGI